MVFCSLFLNINYIFWKSKSENRQWKLLSFPFFSAFTLCISFFKKCKILSNIKLKSNCFTSLITFEVETFFLRKRKRGNFSNGKLIKNNWRVIFALGFTFFFALVLTHYTTKSSWIFRQSNLWDQYWLDTDNSFNALNDRGISSLFSDFFFSIFV